MGDEGVRARGGRVGDDDLVVGGAAEAHLRFVEGELAFSEADFEVCSHAVT